MSRQQDSLSSNASPNTGSGKQTSGRDITPPCAESYQKERNASGNPQSQLQATFQRRNDAPVIAKAMPQHFLNTFFFYRMKM